MTLSPLENLSTAQVAAELATYDAVTRAEATADKDEVLVQIALIEGTNTSDIVTALTPEFDEIDSAIAALENLSAAQVAAELATYDGVTRTEATADKDAIITQGDIAWATATGFATSELAAEMDARFDALDTAVDTIEGTNTSDEIDAAITALEDLSAAQVATELATYDAPTKAEMDSGFAALLDISTSDVGLVVEQKLTVYDAATGAEIAALNDLSAAEVAAELATYDGVTRAEASSDKNEILAVLGSPVADVAADIAAVLALVGGLEDVSVAQITTALETALATTARAEPTTPPAANASIADKLSWVCAHAVNLLENVSGTQTLYAADGVTPIGVTVTTDSAGTTTRPKYT